MRAVLAAAILSLAACSHLASSPLPQIRSELSPSGAVTAFYQQTASNLFSQYYLPQFGGDLAAQRSKDVIKFSDNTIYLGNFIAWQAYTMTAGNYASAVANITATVRHVSQTLTVPSTLPGSGNTQNLGYFTRDNMTQTSLTIGNVAYMIQSDAQNPAANQMSQDQLIHLLFGYFATYQQIQSLKIGDPAAQALLAQISAHADQLGARLKANNYRIVTPEGALVGHGNDARLLSWPIAATLARLTGKPLDTYLTSIEIIDEKDAHGTLSAAEMQKLFLTAIDLLPTGVCDIPLGRDHNDICPRYSMRLINILFNTSGLNSQRRMYIDRMDKDGDYLGGLAARLQIGAPIPDIYLTALQSATSGAFICTVKPQLWCADNRWIRMPTVCPTPCDASDPFFYNGLDFLTLYAMLS